MCTRYITPEQLEIERAWHVGRGNGNPWHSAMVRPWSAGIFVRRARDRQDAARELVRGQWGLVPWFAKERKLPYLTVNARSEEMANKASYKQPWARGQRCIIPAESFDEPNWESGKNVWWRFRRADGMPWGLAGLWNAWTDKATGEILETYTMLTLNADAHPLMRRMHKPDPKLGPDQQDKRSVVAIELEDVDQWLYGTQAEAQALIRLTPAEAMVAGPVEV